MCVSLWAGAVSSQQTKLKHAERDERWRTSLLCSESLPSIVCPSHRRLAARPGLVTLFSPYLCTGSGPPVRLQSLSPLTRRSQDEFPEVVSVMSVAAGGEDGPPEPHVATRVVPLICVCTSPPIPCLPDSCSLSVYQRVCESLTRLQSDRTYACTHSCLCVLFPCFTHRSSDCKGQFSAVVPLTAFL